MDPSPSRSSVHEDVAYKIRILGTGAADPTVEIGQGVTVKHQATGVYRITWAEGPGVFVTWAPGPGAATPADLKGFSFVRDTYDATNHQLDVSVFDASNAAADLNANQYLDMVITFAAGTP